MQVYISTNCLLDKLSLEKILSFYIKAGINKLELSSSNQKLTNLNAVLRRFPAKYLVHNYFPPPKQPFVFNLASLNPEIAQKSLALAKRAIKLCSFLKSPFYSLHGGLLYDASSQLEKKTKTFKPINTIVHNKEKALFSFLANLKILQKFASKFNVRLLIENNVSPPILKNKLLFVDDKDFLWLFSQKEMKQVGVLLDTGHLKVSAETYGFSADKVIEKLKDKITALHLHDNNGLADLHWKIKKGSWIEKVIRKLNNSDPYLILEARVKSIKEVIEQKEYLESL